jgi:hypothetical protein
MRTHSEIVKAVGSPEKVAEHCGVSVHTVRSWIQRDSIPADQWAAFAKDEWATLEELAMAAARRAA